MDPQVPPQPEEYHIANLAMAISGVRLEVQLPVPAATVGPEGLLPAFQILTEAIEAATVQNLAESGLSISCRAGCGACCRQLVPIAEIEARALRAHVEAQPPEIRAAILERFDDARRRLEAAGMLDILQNPRSVTRENRLEIGLSYFNLGIPCPFLVDESCSIHEIRPLVCREFLVTSPPEHCSDPAACLVDRVPMPARLSGLLARFGDDERPGRTTWVPLVLALEWDKAHSDDLRPRPGPEWAVKLLRFLTGRELPLPEDLG